MTSRASSQDLVDPAIAIAAEAWQLIGEVIQRHPDQGHLRLVELRPGGGQGHVLTLLKMERPTGVVYRDPATPLIEFNLLSARWALHGEDFPRWVFWRDEAGKAQLASTLEAISAALGLSPRPEPFDRTVSGLVFLAAILNSEWGRAEQLSATMGYCDTSGEGAGIRNELLQFPALYRPEEQIGEGWREGLATSYWLIHKGRARELIGCIRTNGQFGSLRAPPQCEELHLTYGHPGGLADMVEAAMTALR